MISRRNFLKLTGGAAGTAFAGLLDACREETNGDLFTHEIAFSPGFAVPAAREGSPRILVSHGVHDNVLPIDRCTRRIVPQLERAGYEVRYREFDGPHTVPESTAREALE
jgi:phospholipase/carboxylesterase